MQAAKIYDEIENVYSVKKSEASDYIEALKITDRFLKQNESKKDELKRRRILQTKFVYFWEFYNKTTKGTGALNTNELPKAQKLFFSMMHTDKFNNMKQVEPMIRAMRDKHSWELLVKSKGSRIDLVEALHKESKAIRSIEDKIRNFSKWIDKLLDAQLTNASKKLLKDMVNKIKNLLTH